MKEEKELIRIIKKLDAIKEGIQTLLKKENVRTSPPKGYRSWYAYLEDRRAKSDFDLLEWTFLQEKSEFGLPDPITQKCYFQKWLDQKAPGAFVAWVRKDIPKWKSS